MVKKFFSAFFAIFLIFLIPFSVNAYEPTGISISAKSALLVSLDTGEVIYNKNENEKVYPASITKIMTSVLMLESEKFNPEAKIAMTDEVLKIISGTGSSVSNLKSGEEITQLDLLYMVLMSSFGDTAYLAAIYYGGSVDGFVDMMNAKAQELGLSGTHYTNPVGLHHDQNYTTASDTYILTKYALENKTFKEACKSTRYTVGATNMSPARTISTTIFLQDNTTNYYYSYAEGVKTGFTDEAGRCLVSTASYNGYNYICILFGCPTDAAKRYDFLESKELYRWAFNNFRFKSIANTENPVCELGVDLSLETDFVSLYVEESFVSVLPKDADESTITIKPNLPEKNASAPIKKGDVLATADIIYAEQKLGTVNLISHENIKRSVMLTVLNAVKNFLISPYMKVVYVVLLAVIIIFIVATIRLNQKAKKRRKVKYIPMDKNKH